MNNVDRADRMKALSKVALGIIRRCGERWNVDRPDGRWRRSEVRHNEFRLTHSRLIDDKDRTSTLDVRFDGKIVLQVEWTTERVLRTSYRPGAWEAMLLRYDRVPALSGSAALGDRC
ncbi:hypothetical protein CWO91_34805 [Bradyrhizobium genosp. SA-3]|uniref:hypothetical protein n=1 Tax=Bradyrhizobium genosp. SA-3 TaxID=508868 RepID=UPI00102966FD|nr:hypothetical protein [Bradyrhizobium genosp. SA-3]RZM99944.1 hypothetical protein CWO91_34805 [Bradyrhizobium genosp. SA-3]